MLLQDDDLAAVGAALALQAGEAQGEDQAPALGVLDGGHGGRQGPAAEVAGLAPASAAGEVSCQRTACMPSTPKASRRPALSLSGTGMAPG
ncbi:hypothetical protein GCM10020000_45180 [Streptomyces olivoverticillatus]